MSDPAAAVKEALSEPVHYPPLSRAVVPGDRVVVAMDPDVPQAGPLASGVVQALMESVVEAENITIVQTERHLCRDDMRAWLPAGAEQVSLAVHDPADESQLAYLATAADDTAIVLNRLLCDADLVIPVNLLRPESTPLYAGPYAGICPTFSDVHTQQQFRGPEAMGSSEQRRRLWEKANEVAWFLGIQLTVQVVAGAGESVLDVLAGMDGDVSSRGHALVNATWAHNVSGKAELVVATIEGDGDSQSWDNLRRALHAAQQACVPNGAIVLCTDLSLRPGPALEQWIAPPEKETLLTKGISEPADDSLATRLLGGIREVSHIFLLSQLDEEAVESMGMGHIEEPEQVNRLCRQYDSCILLGNAHRAMLRPVGNR